MLLKKAYIEYCMSKAKILYRACNKFAKTIHEVLKGFWGIRIYSRYTKFITVACYLASDTFIASNWRISKDSNLSSQCRRCFILLKLLETDLDTWSYVLKYYSVRDTPTLLLRFKLRTANLVWCPNH